MWDRNFPQIYNLCHIFCYTFCDKSCYMNYNKNIYICNYEIVIIERFIRILLILKLWIIIF